MMDDFDVGPWIYVVYEDQLPKQLIQGSAEAAKLNLQYLPVGSAYRRVGPQVMSLQDAPEYDADLVTVV